MVSFKLLSCISIAVLTTAELSSALLQSNTTTCERKNSSNKLCDTPAILENEMREKVR